MKDPSLPRDDRRTDHKNVILSVAKNLRSKSMGVEIEKKFLINSLPEDLNRYPFHMIEQGYLNVYPAIRVRREDDICYMTYKGDLLHDDPQNAGSRGDIGKVEYNLPLDAASYKHMVSKADGNLIRKKRYLLPLNQDAYTIEYLDRRPELSEMMENGDLKIELDVFEEPFMGQIIAEVEFPDEEAAREYKKADWFGKEVTGDKNYSNAYMSSLKL